jgi:hypothetical protein
MPAAPPTYRQFVTTVSMMIVSAIVAIEKKMPCMRRVRRPRANPISAPIAAAVRICRGSGAPNALTRNTEE